MDITYVRIDIDKVGVAVIHPHLIKGEEKIFWSPEDRVFGPQVRKIERPWNEYRTPNAKWLQTDPCECGAVFYAFEDFPTEPPKKRKTRVRKSWCAFCEKPTASKNDFRMTCLECGN